MRDRRFRRTQLDQEQWATEPCPLPRPLHLQSRCRPHSPCSPLSFIFLLAHGACHVHLCGFISFAAVNSRPRDDLQDPKITRQAAMTLSSCSVTSPFPPPFLTHFGMRACLRQRFLFGFLKRAVQGFQRNKGGRGGRRGRREGEREVEASGKVKKSSNRSLHVGFPLSNTVGIIMTPFKRSGTSWGCCVDCREVSGIGGTGGHSKTAGPVRWGCGTGRSRGDPAFAGHFETGCGRLQGFGQKRKGKRQKGAKRGQTRGAGKGGGSNPGAVVFWLKLFAPLPPLPLKEMVHNPHTI